MTKLLNLFRRRRNRLERDLDRELRYHIDRRVEDLIKDGLSEPEAQRRASIELGGVPQVQEAVRDTWIWRWLDELLRDARYAMRSLTRSWGFTAGAGAVLALTIGANIAIFSVVNTVLLRPLAYPDAERLVSVETLWTNTGRASQDVSGPDFLDWQAKNDVFEQLAAYFGGNETPVIVGDRAVFANSAYVSAEFFAVFGQSASAGRLLTQDDVPAEQAPATAAVVAYHWAATHFGSDRDAIGKRITVYGDTVEIVGVATPGFRYPGSTDIWSPMRATAHAPNRSDHPYQSVGKLKGEADITRAQAQMRAIGDALAGQYPENRFKTATVIPLQQRLTGSLEATLWVLMSAVGVVWLIGCANIANLLLARAAGRTREIALRTALGAGRVRVMRQVLTESCVLAGGAGLVGLLLASLLVQGVVALSPANVPRIDDARIDATVLGFALGISLVSTALFGLVPALHASRLDLSTALKQGGSKATASRAGVRLRSVLVVAEVALSVILLATAGLLVRSFVALQQVDLGFTTDRVLVAYTEYAVRDDVVEDLWTRSRFYADVLDRLRNVPGVSAASGVAYLGMGREPRSPRDVYIQGRPEGRPGERPQAEYHAITADYFKTLEIPVRAGRDFDSTDTPERPRVAIVNETLARTAFPGESPIGQRIQTGTNRKAAWMEIVGVVGDTRWQDPSQPARAVIYAASTQGAGNSLSILARTSLDSQSLAGTLRTLLHDANPTVPVKFETMDELFDSALAYPRFRTQVIGLFAGVAVVLAAVGIFSVLAYLVGQRTRELAIRRALGARTVDVIPLIVGQGLRLVAIGLVLGLAGAFTLGRLMTGLLFEISPWDAGTYLGTIAVLGGAALLATLVPAIRAATIAPLVVLQQE
ncbi:MAG TPA: ABC transporter permease [Vicinamibacterales bacterium]|nr:ABC transporter permease [Vicinamibacterales bacterium]